MTCQIAPSTVTRISAVSLQASRLIDDLLNGGRLAPITNAENRITDTRAECNGYAIPLPGNENIEGLADFFALFGTTFLAAGLFELLNANFIDQSDNISLAASYELGKLSQIKDLLAQIPPLLACGDTGRCFDDISVSDFQSEVTASINLIDGAITSPIFQPYWGQDPNCVIKDDGFSFDPKQGIAGILRYGTVNLINAERKVLNTIKVSLSWGVAMYGFGYNCNEEPNNNNNGDDCDRIIEAFNGIKTALENLGVLFPDLPGSFQGYACDDRETAEYYNWTGRGFLGVVNQINTIHRHLNEIEKRICNIPPDDFHIIHPVDAHENITLISQLQLLWIPENEEYKRGTSIWTSYVPNPRADIDWCRDIDPLRWQRGGAAHGAAKWGSGFGGMTSGHFANAAAATELMTRLISLSQNEPVTPKITTGINLKRPRQEITVKVARASILIYDEQKNLVDKRCLMPPKIGELSCEEQDPDSLQ